MQRDRRKSILLILLAMIVLAVAPADTKAANDDARIRKLEAAVEALQAELATLKAERAVEKRQQAAIDRQYVDKLVSQAVDKNKRKVGQVPAWVSSIKWRGDFRYRYEFIDDSRRGRTRNRNRIRARLGMKATLDDEWDVGFRIATGDSDTATSANQTLDETFEQKDLWLDRAYADYHPRNIDGLNIVMGKMAIPFYRTGGNQLILDSDVNPEGGALKYRRVLSDNVTAYVNGGAFWLDERSEDEDSSLFGIQGYLKHAFDDGTKMTAGVSYYDFGNVEGKTLSGGSGLLGNTAAADGVSYKYDYNLVEGFADYGFTVSEMPMLVYGNYIENMAASNSANDAYSVGIRINRAKAPGSWQAGYQWLRVENDAVLSTIADSDPLDGTTGVKGHKFGFKYQLTDNIQSGLTYFDCDNLKTDEDYQRLQLDMIFKF
ncbi:MAG: putative porin [Planctomycetes bacterium]|nr:putative porin [Planctomycetota bacterium]